MQYRLGIDLGTNSLGWAAISLRDDGAGGFKTGPLLDMGVRIFSDARNPKDKSSNAAQRRGPRAMRRNRDRKRGRSRAMLRALIDARLLPASSSERKTLEALDPWVLRAQALSGRLEPFKIGRALFHLQKRRGFKSNRKTDGDAEGAVFDAIQAARDRMSGVGARTLGELFGRPRIEQAEANLEAVSGQGRPLPQARVKADLQGNRTVYDHYPSRDMILDEFEQIWSAQAIHHPEILTSNAHDDIRRVLEHQRPLKPQRAGKCTFLPDEPRAPKALPSIQFLRVLADVNNLEVGAAAHAPRRLSTDERERLLTFLIRPTSKTARRSFGSIRRLLNLPDSHRFNLESSTRDHLVGAETAARLMQPEAWGLDWLDLDRDQQDEVVAKLLEVEDEGDLVDWLMEGHGLTWVRAQAVARARLPDGHGRLSLAAVSRLLPTMEAGARYDEAARTAFGDHRALGDGVVYEDGLPYYGEILSRHTAFERDDPSNDEERFGRVANPTVHVALNELRKVVNDLIGRWGAPDQVVLELSRDLPLSDRGLRELESQQKTNQAQNDERRAQLQALKVADTYENRLKLRLYEEALEAFGGTALCVFSGQTIAMTSLFSAEVEVEHILPRSRTLDDSFANKILSARHSNRVKRNMSPFEAFGDSPEGFDWESIGQRATQLPSSKAWRFSPNAMETWEERGGGFLARQLNDTRYIARLGKSYVEGLFGGQGAKGVSRRVWVVPGQLTADLRHHAGFNTLTGLRGGNRKDRTDHRHHAVDALVVALTDHAMIERAARLSRREDKIEHDEVMQVMAEPLKRYRPSAEDRLSKLTVSHKPDHGFQDAMHNDTAYGVTGDQDDSHKVSLVSRKPLRELKPDDLDRVADPIIRSKLNEATSGLSGTAFVAALVKAGEAMHPPVRRIRLTTQMKPSSLVVVRHGQSCQHAKAYKGDGNYCYDIFLSDAGKWTGEVITTFEAYRLALEDTNWWTKTTRPDGSPLIMRIRKGDMLELDGPAGERVCVVVYKFTAGRVNMAEHFEANASARIRCKELAGYQMSPRSLEKVNAVRLSVSPSGRVRRHKPSV